VVRGLAPGTAPSELVALRLEVPPEEGAELERRAIHRRLVRIRNELRFLEVHLSDHPMAVLLPQASRLFCVTAAEADRLSGRRVRFAGTVAAMRRVPAGADVVRFLTLEDESGLLEARVLPSLHARAGNQITTPGPFLLEERLWNDLGAVHLDVERLGPFHERRLP